MHKVEQLKKLKVSNYPEISIKGLWDKFKEDDDVKKYFPDFKPTAKKKISTRHSFDR